MVQWDTTLNGTHISVTVDGTLVGFEDVAPGWGTMTLVLSKPINVDGQVVNITITDAGAAEIKTDTGRPMDGGASIERIYAAPPEFEKIRVTDAENGKVTLYFSKDVFAEYLGQADIKAMINGNYRNVAGIEAAWEKKDATDTIVVKLNQPMITEGQTVEITITATGAEKIKEAVGEVSMLSGNTRSEIHTAETAPEFEDTWTNEFGSAIIVEFDRTWPTRTTNRNGFGPVVNGEEKTESRALDGDNKKRIVLSIREDDTIKAGDTVNLTYTPGSGCGLKTADSSQPSTNAS